MSRDRPVIPFILAALLVAVPLVVLLTLVFWPERLPSDRTNAPEWLKRLCRTGSCQWRPWDEFVIHHSGTKQGNLEIIDRYHRTQRHWEAAGYHFVIGNGTRSGDGEIEVGSRWYNQSIGSHCRGHNEKAIGISLIGNFELKGHKPSLSQMLSLAQLTAYLSLRCGIPIDRVHLHREMPDAVTLCPGKNFPVKQFKRLLEAVREDYRPR